MPTFYYLFFGRDIAVSPFNLKAYMVYSVLCLSLLEWIYRYYNLTSFVTHSDVGIMCNCTKQATASSGSRDLHSAPLCFYRLLFLYALLETRTYQLERVFLIFFFSYVKCCGRSYLSWERHKMWGIELAGIVCKLEWKDQLLLKTVKLPRKCCIKVLKK